VESLALKYRPTDFDDLVGQRAVNIVLRQMVATNRIPHALLFSGPRGTGKTTTARIFAAALNCTDPAGICGSCPSCKAVHSGSSLDIVEIDAASNGLVDDMRALRQQVLYSVGGIWRVVVLDEAHSMSQAAFNVLLKTLEEPPPQTVFILATTEPGKILDTVVSRCMAFRFQRISIADMVDRLTHICATEQITVDPLLLRLLAERADGAMRDAIMALDQIARVGITDVTAYTELMGETDTGPILLTAMTSGDHATAYTTLDHLLTRTGDIAGLSTALIGTLRDLLILQAEGTLTRQGDALATRQRLARLIPTTTVVGCMSVLWDLKTKLSAGDDQRAGLELAVALVMDKLTTQTQKTTPTPAPAPGRRLTLQEMAAMR